MWWQGVWALAAKHAVSQDKWSLGGQPLGVCDNYKYLGVEFTQSRASGKWNLYLKRILAKARDVANLTLWQGHGAGGLRPRTFKALWVAKCRPLLEYGSELWEGEISLEWIAKLESATSSKQS